MNYHGVLLDKDIGVLFHCYIGSQNLGCSVLPITDQVFRSAMLTSALLDRCAFFTGLKLLRFGGPGCYVGDQWHPQQPAS